MDAHSKQFNKKSRHFRHHQHNHHSSHTSTISTMVEGSPQSTSAQPFSPTEITPTIVSVGQTSPKVGTTPTITPITPTIPTTTIPTTTPTTTLTTTPKTPPTTTPIIPITSPLSTIQIIPTTITGTKEVDTIIIQSTMPSSKGSSSAPIIQESDRIPIIIAVSSFVVLLFLSLLFIYVRKKLKKSRQNSLASAIVAAEAGELPRSTLRDSPSPPPPPPPPPPTPTPLPHALLNDDDIPPPPRYKISTLQIEPMTKRLTMNLSQKGKSMVINDDNRPNQIRRGSEITGEGEIDIEEQEVINVISLRDDDDDDESSEGEGDSKGKGFKRFSSRNFWK